MYPETRHLSSQGCSNLGVGLRFILPLLFCLPLSVGCLEVDDEDGGETGAPGPRPFTTLILEPTTLDFPQGESGTLFLDLRTNETSSADYVFSGFPEEMEIELDLSGRTPRRRYVAEATISGGELDPGIYRGKVEARLFGAFALDERPLTVVVVPVEVTPAGEVRELAAGGYHSLALLEDGTLWSWGRNDHGQLGDGTLIDRPVPVQVTGLPRPAVAIAAGRAHSLAVLDDGTVWGWGDNSENQVGYSPFGNVSPAPDASTPQQVICAGPGCENGALEGGLPLGTIVAVAAGRDHSMAVDASGTVWTWGSNKDFQLGRDSGLAATGLTIPARIVAVAAAGEFSLALEDDGRLWGWGNNRLGQLGDDFRVEYERPVDLFGFTDVRAIAAGSDHALGLLGDGTVKTWGSNTFGQLGVPERDGPFARRVPGLFDVVAVDAGFAHSLVLLDDGTARAWGNNAFNQLGFPEIDGGSDYFSPVLVQGPSDLVAIAAGGRHCLSMVENCPTAWSWGDNIVGQLGDGTNHQRPFPVQVDRFGQLGDLGSCEAPLTMIREGEGVVSSEPVGINCGDGCAASFEFGTGVTLTATPQEGWDFDGWGGDCVVLSDPLNPTLEVTVDQSLNCFATFSRRVNPPRASFTFDPFGPIVHFDASGSSDPDGQIVEYAWDFENDSVFDGEGVEATNIYAEAGTYTVRLRVIDNDGAVGETTRQIVVQEEPSYALAARFEFLPAAPRPGDLVEFDASPSFDVDGQIVLYQWDFQNDGTFDAEGAVSSFTFNQAGVYTVRLRVTDDVGTYSEITHQVTVVESTVPNGPNVTLTLDFRGGGQGTVTMDPLGSVCSEDCTVTVSTGTQLFLIPTPQTSFFFSHWEGCDQDLQAEGCVVNLNSDRTVVVYFE